MGRRLGWMMWVAGLCFSGVLFAAAPKGIVRGIYCRPGPAMDSLLWRKYGRGYVLDTHTVHSGTVSIRCANGDDEGAHGAWQPVDLNQEHARPIIVAGWAKLEDVAEPRNYKCSVYVDLRLKSGKNWSMKIATFDPAKTGWQYAEEIYTPPEPIRSARVYAFLREKAGCAWFDDLYIGEILDDQGTRSDNRLQQAGFERVDTDVNPRRNEFFETLESMNCNAFHFYDSVGWSTVSMTGALPALDPDDPMPGFVKAAQQRGFGVWMTVGLGWPRVTDFTDQDSPLYACVNNRWGETYTRAVAYMARSGVDGIGVVPDEWTFTTGRLKRAYAKHGNPRVAEFYRSLPGYAHCPVCDERFRKRFGKAAPDLGKPWSTPDPVWGKYLAFRYEESTRWIRRTVRAAKAVNPDVVTDTMICVLPVCSDNRIGAGAAWDLIGAETGLDCLQTDPYILLHNYLGDSTHYYTTETAIHLTAANWKGRSGVTLEACRLRDDNRPKDPAEVYGSALSCLVHGAREFFWWHMNHVTGKTAFIDAEAARCRLTAAHEVMRRLEPYLLNARPSGDLLVLYSRRSEDIQHWLSKAGEDSVTEPPQEAQALGDNKVRKDEELKSRAQQNIRAGFVAHKHVLYWLLRRGYAFRTTFLEHPDPAALRAADTVLVPFPLALTVQEARTIARLTRQGKTVIIMSCLGSRDEWGQPLPVPRLASLFRSGSPSVTSSTPVASRLGRGKVIFLGGDFARRLFEPIEAQKDRSKHVPLPRFDQPRTAILESLVGSERSVFAQQPDLDVEAVVIQGTRGKLVLAINWDLQATVKLRLRSDVLGEDKTAQGFSIDGDADVRPFTWNPQDAPLQLAPQQAVLLRLIQDN